MVRRNRLRAHAARGMTLIEIMVVMAIIGMLLGTAGFFAFGALERSRVKQTKILIHNVEQALVQYAVDNTDPCPKALSDLVTQKYMTKEPMDAWGSPLTFKCPGEHNTDGADIISKGKDKQEGTADDVKSWEQ